MNDPHVHRHEFREVWMKRAAIIGWFLVTASTAILGGCAQYDAYGRPTETGVLNHDVQRMWDDTFNPGRDGDRTAYERRREAERRDWCRYHADYGRCGPYR